MQLMLQCNFRIVKLDVEYATDKFGRQTNFFQVEEFQISLCGQLTQIVVQIYNQYLRTDVLLSKRNSDNDEHDEMKASLSWRADVGVDQLIYRTNESKRYHALLG